MRIQLAIAIGATLVVAWTTGRGQVRHADGGQEANPGSCQTTPDQKSIFQAAEELLGAGKYDAAIRKYDQIIRESPRSSVQYIQRRGEAYFMNAQMKKAVADFDRVIDLAPKYAPHNWQRGLALYYAGDFGAGRQQFELHQTVNPQDVENSVWHFLCVARQSGIDEARKSIIPIDGDTRIPMKQIHALYAGSGNVEEVLAAATGDGESGKKKPDETAKSNSRLYYAHLYVGLYYEVYDRPDLAKKYLLLAGKTNPYQPNVLMGRVASVHLKLLDEEKAAADKSEQSRNRKKKIPN